MLAQVPGPRSAPNLGHLSAATRPTIFLTVPTGATSVHCDSGKSKVGPVRVRAAGLDGGGGWFVPSGHPCLILHGDCVFAGVDEGAVLVGAVVKVLVA